ncbi:NPCBM/NEW2 domain-containing protein, partial [Sphingomonas sanguinis]
APHQTLIYRVTGAHRLANGHYLSEAPSDVNPAEDGIATPEGDPTIHHELSPWGGSKGPGDFPQYGGWGGAQADRTPFGRPLRLMGKVYDTGIGVLANSRLEVRNRGQSRFAATVGIDDSATARGQRVVFEVYGDGMLLARSRPVTLNETPAAIEADVRGRQIVELVARPDSAPEAALPVVWGDAQLID